MGTPAAIALPDWSARLMNELDDSDRRARELLSPLTVEQLNWRSADGTWSIGQCLQHLCFGTEVYMPPIVAALEGKPISPVQEIQLGWLARWFLRSYIEPSAQTKRAKAPKKIVPASRIERSVLERFLSGNQSVREVIRRAAAYDVNRIRFKNPFISGVRFTVGTGLQLTCSHQRRHLLQAERVKASANFPG
jgi:DinB superfamily